MESGKSKDEKGIMKNGERERKRRGVSTSAMIGMGFKQHAFEASADES